MKSCYSCGCTDYDVKYSDTYKEWYCETCLNGLKKEKETMNQKELKKKLNNVEISLNSKYQFLINNIVIKDKIFNNELFDFRIEKTEAFIKNLIDWISESKGNDKYLMIEDLKYLMNLKDKFIFSSILTNEYIAQSDNNEEFNKLCFDLLELNKTIEVQEKEEDIEQ